MQEIKKIGVFSMAKIEAALGAVIGFIVGIIWAIIAVFVRGFAEVAGAPMRTAGPIFGVAAIVIMPLLYAVIGFIGGALIAFLYNVIAGWIGGIEIELEEVK
ncbi:MAG: hypothetical protein AYK19_21075 [Theionarchaea archaeon DG-70-1]|nr:MAG: hypothetical protein AYK19_21075 [Theionarchaea archaeon DG-70-1]